VRIFYQYSAKPFMAVKEKVFPTPIWLIMDIKMLVRNCEGSIKVYNIFLIIYCPGQ